MERNGAERSAAQCSVVKPSSSAILLCKQGVHSTVQHCASCPSTSLFGTGNVSKRTCASTDSSEVRDMMTVPCPHGVDPHCTCGVESYSILIAHIASAQGCPYARVWPFSIRYTRV
eukprot:359442-Chlamydomonas_euryale.AAC.1